jgi:hypothetical protein
MPLICSRSYEPMAQQDAPALLIFQSATPSAMSLFNPGESYLLRSMIDRDNATLQAVFDQQTRPNISWIDVMHLCNSLGGDVQIFKDHRVRVRLTAGGYHIWLNTSAHDGQHALSSDHVLQLRRFLKLAGLQSCITVQQNCSRAAENENGSLEQG